MNEDNEELTNAGPISALQEAACDDGVVCRSVQWQGTGPGTPCLDQNEDSDICLNTRMNHSLSPAQNSILFGNKLTPNPELIAGDDIRQKLEFHHVHLELGALGYIKTFLFYWYGGFFQKKNPPRPIVVFQNTRVPPLDLKKYFF